MSSHISKVNGMGSYVLLNILNVLLQMDILLYGLTGRIYVRMNYTISGN